MFRKLLRTVRGRIGRTQLVLLVLAAVWGVWWVWPQSPDRSLVIASTTIDDVYVAGDGRYACITESDAFGVYRLICLADGKETLTAKKQDIGLRLLDNAHYALFHRDNGGLVVFDLEQFKPAFEEKENVVILEYSDSGGVILAQTADARARMVIYRPFLARQFELPESAVQPVALDSQGRVLISAVKDKAALVIWDVDSGNEQRRLTLPDLTDVRSISLSPDGRHALTKLSTAGRRETFVLWDLCTGKQDTLDVVNSPNSLGIDAAGFLGNKSCWAHEANRGNWCWDWKTGALTSFLLNNSTGTTAIPIMNDAGDRCLTIDTLIPDDAALAVDVPWYLFDVQSRSCIAIGAHRDWARLANEYLSGPHWSRAYARGPQRLNAGNWVAIPRTKPLVLIQWIEKIFGRSILPRKALDVVAWNTGRIINRVYCESEWPAGLTNDGYLWTYEQRGSNLAKQTTLILRQYRLGIHIPFWLYLLTAAAVMIILADWLVLRRRRVTI